VKQDLKIWGLPTEFIFFPSIPAGPGSTMLGECARGLAVEPESAAGTPCPFITLFSEYCAQPVVSGVNPVISDHSVFLSTSTDGNIPTGGDFSSGTSTLPESQAHHLLPL